jgi:hypothetical protein
MNTFFRTCLATVFLAFGLSVVSAMPTQAYVAGGPAALKLNPTSATATTGQNFTMKVMFTTGGQAVSGVAARLTYSVPATPDLEVVSVTPNASLGWSFPVQSAAVSGGKMNVDIMGLTSAAAGYSGTGDIELATITFRASSAFSSKALSFDQSQSQILKKSDASDILGSLGTGTVTASGGSVNPITPSPTPTAASNPVPTPTPEAAGTATPTPTTSTTTTDTTSTDTTTAVADSSGTGGTVETPQTQALPVSGSAGATVAVALAGLALVGGAVFMKMKQG